MELTEFRWAQGSARPSLDCAVLGYVFFCGAWADNMTDRAEYRGIRAGLSDTKKNLAVLLPYVEARGLCHGRPQTALEKKWNPKKHELALTTCQQSPTRALFSGITPHSHLLVALCLHSPPTPFWTLENNGQRTRSSLWSEASTSLHATTYESAPRKKLAWPCYSPRYWAFFYIHVV